MNHIPTEKQALLIKTGTATIEYKKGYLFGFERGTEKAMEKITKLQAVRSAANKALRIWSEHNPSVIFYDSLPKSEDDLPSSDYLLSAMREIKQTSLACIEPYNGSAGYCAGEE